MRWIAFPCSLWFCLALAGTAAAQDKPAQQPDGPAPKSKADKPPKLTGEEKELERIRQLLNCSDEEWFAIRPMVARVNTLQNELRASRDKGLKPPKEDKAGKVSKKDREALASATPNPNKPTAPEVIDAAHNLRDTLSDREASISELRQRVIATRQARAKVRADLTQAQEALREVISVRQEATLILLGLLD